MSITIACNGHSVLDRLQGKKSINPFAAHVDILWACKSIQEQMACKIKFLHVRGHQDNRHPMVLSREAWLNIETDLAAKNCISNFTPETSYQPLPFEPWCLIINNVKIVKHHQQAIHVAMNGPAAKQYWTTKLPDVPQLQMELDLEAME